MQKIFRRYLIIIMSAAIFLIMAGNCIFQVRALERQQYSSFSEKISQVIHTMENNQTEMADIERNLDEDYLTRAKAAAYVFEQNEDVLHDVKELQNLARLLDVDELHVIDENGILVYSSVPKYIGLNFYDHDQTREFVKILESDEETYLIQETRPNAAEDKIMKYIGVSRKDQKGIIQIGLKPVRQLEAEERNTYAYIFSRFPTDTGEEYFVVSYDTGELLGHTNGVSEENQNVHVIERMTDCEKGAFKKMEDGKIKYIVTRRYEDVLIGVSVSVEKMFSKLWEDMIITFVYLLFLEIMIVMLLNYLVKKKVVEGIHGILKDLSQITNGNMDTTVSVGGNPEFEELSSGINMMVKSIEKNSNRLSKIIEISGLPLAAFEYQKGIEHVFVTSGTRELLNLEMEEMDCLCRNAQLFYGKIHELMQNPLKGETDVFCVGEQKYIRIHFSEDTDGFLGIITDVTRYAIEKQRIQYDNNHDPLTGLGKYPYFKQRAAEKLANMAEGELCACVMLDLDAFKEINDTYGHDKGDLYLQSFAGIMRRMPKEHCLLCRRAGDEFSMMIYGYADREEIRALLHEFWGMLEKADVPLAEQKRSIRASGGVSWCEDPKMDIAVLLSQADEALYSAKRKGKGCFEECIYKEKEMD